MRQFVQRVMGLVLVIVLVGATAGWAGQGPWVKAKDGHVPYTGVALSDGSFVVQAQSTGSTFPGRLVMKQKAAEVYADQGTKGSNVSYQVLTNTLVAWCAPGTGTAVAFSGNRTLVRQARGSSWCYGATESDGEAYVFCPGSDYSQQASDYTVLCLQK